MTFDEFQNRVGECYDELPKEFQDKFSVYVVEDSKEVKNAFAFYTSMFPNAITLIYKVFLDHKDFSKDHIHRVLKHEFEHVLIGKIGRAHV